MLMFVHKSRKSSGSSVLSLSRGKIKKTPLNLQLALFYLCLQERSKTPLTRKRAERQQKRGKRRRLKKQRLGSRVYIYKFFFPNKCIYIYMNDYNIHTKTNEKWMNEYEKERKADWTTMRNITFMERKVRNKHIFKLVKRIQNEIENIDFRGRHMRTKTKTLN